MNGFVGVMLTFGFQVDVLIWPSLGAVHEFPHDDGKAVDITFGRSFDQLVDLSQKLRGGPVHLCNTTSQTDGN